MQTIQSREDLVHSRAKFYKQLGQNILTHLTMKNVNLSIFLIFMIIALSGCNKEPVPDHWYLQSSGVEKDLYSVHFTDDNTGFAVGVSGIILKTTNGGKTWKLVNSPASDDWLTSVYFPEDSIGFIAGHGGTILKTEDSGNTWTRLLTDLNLDLNGVFFVNTSIGFATGYTVTGIGENFGLDGIIIKTTNGGKNWAAVDTVVNSALNSLYFIDVNTGYAVGQNGTIMKTTDGGDTWDMLISGSSNDIQTVTFVNKNLGFAGGGPFSDDFGEILKTEDGGQTWTSILTQSRRITSVSFLDPDMGYATSYDDNLYGVILKTDNGGSTWTKYETGMTFPMLLSVCISNSHAVYAVGAVGTILKWGM